MKNTILRKLILVLSLSATALMLNGCASSATVSGMTASVSGVKANEKLRQSIDVPYVSGGSDTNPFWTSQISSPDFRNALINSLIGAGYKVSHGDKTKYTLSAHLKKVEQPFFGLDMTVVLTIQYVLTDYATGTTLLTQDIISTHTATFGDAFYGPTRLRLANEGAAKKNIEQALRSLQGFDPSKTQLRVN